MIWFSKVSKEQSPDIKCSPHFSRRLTIDKKYQMPLELTLPYLALKLLSNNITSSCTFPGFLCHRLLIWRFLIFAIILGHQGQMDCEPRSICQCCFIPFSQHFAIIARCSCIYKSPGLNNMTTYLLSTLTLYLHI